MSHLTTPAGATRAPAGAPPRGTGVPVRPPAPSSRR